MNKKVLPLLLVLLVSGCGTRDKALEAEIAHAEERISALEASIEVNTTSSSSRTEDIEARLAYRPMHAWANAFNMKSPADRTIRFQQTGRTGQIAAESFDCGWFGRGGWYVETNSNDATRASVLIGRLALRPHANGLDLAAPLQLHARTQLHWHFDPCLGGGVGGSIGVEGSKDIQTVSRFSVGRPIGSLLPYSVMLVEPRKIDITLQVGFEHIGTLGIPISFDGIASELTSGMADLAFETTGVVGPLPDGRVRVYRLTTRSPNVRTSNEAIDASVGVAVTLEPPQ